MLNTDKKVGVILLNMGGPDSLEAVRPFLYNLFSDHDIIQIPKLIQKPVARIISTFRAKKVRKYYQLIGGKSPQKEQTLKQALALQKKLGYRYRVVVAMRYWHPFTEEAVRDLLREDIKEIILVPLYPQFSKTTTGSSFNEFDRVYKKLNLNIPVKRVVSYHNHPLYIKAMVEQIKKYLPDYKDYYFLFSAHSLPLKVIKSGDPYQKQTEETVNLIMNHFPENRYSLAYQSKVGFVKWLEPMTDEEIIRLKNEGVEKLAIIPVSFVSEHSETLYELDIQYKKLAEDIGIKDFKRIPTLQNSELFIECLKDLIVKINENSEIKSD